MAILDKPIKIVWLLDIVATNQPRLRPAAAANLLCRDGICQVTWKPIKPAVKPAA